MSIRTSFCLLFILNFFASTLALPSPTKTYDQGEYDPVGKADYEDDITRIKVDPGFCTFKLGQVPLCSSYGTCLTPPPRRSRPVAVVLGVGTQNYTCSSPTATPTPNGALATLYDISCLVGAYPKAAHSLGTVVMRAGLHTLQDVAKGNVPLGLGYPKVGEHHFAPDAMTAVFNVQLGKRCLKFVGGRVEGIAAPGNALEGTIDWLKLGRKPGSERESRGVKFVYRVYTAGGKPPATCEGIKGEHTVNYATEYWFYD